MRSLYIECWESNYQTQDLVHAKHMLYYKHTYLHPPYQIFFFFQNMRFG